MFGRKLTIRDGFYLEMDDITVEQEGERLTVRQTGEEMYVSEFLRLLKNRESFLPAYLDRNILAGSPTRRLQIHIIFRGKQETQPNPLEKPEKPVVQYPGVFEKEQAERDIRAIRDRLEEELRTIDRQQDFAERVVNGGFFTDEQQMFMGRMSGNDYADSRNFREYLKQEKIEKANRDIARRRYAIDQMEQRAADALRRYEKQLAAYEARERKRNRITLMRCGMAVWQKEKLAALLLLRDKNPVWNIYGPKERMLSHMEGSVYDVEVLGEKKPEAEPLLKYMEEAYHTALPDKFNFEKVRERL